MDRLTLKTGPQGTSLDAIAKFMERQDQNATILAKKDDQGNTVLYTREANQLKGIKGLFTELKDKWNARSGNDKASVAKREVESFLKEYANTTRDELNAKADKLDGGHKAVSQLANAIDLSGQMLGLDKPVVSQMSAVLSNLDLLTTAVTNIIDTNIALKDDVSPLPQTQNASLGGGITRTDAFDRLVTTPDLQIGGKTYTCDKLIGTGGGGTVYSYVAVDGSKLAVKIPPDYVAVKNPEEHNEGATRELSNNARVMGNNPNVTGFSQHVMLDNGLVALVGDIMTNGSATELGEILNKTNFALSDMMETPSGMIGDLERKLVALTTIQDTANGLAELKDPNGKPITHGDMKSQNVMLDSNGVAKLIDLGESARTDTVIPGNYKFPDSALYSAPESSQLQVEARSRNNDLRAANTKSFGVMLEGLLDSFDVDNAQLDDNMKDTVKNSVKDYAKSISSSLASFVLIKQNAEDLKVGATFDSYGLGTMAFELLVGGRATQDVEGNFATETEKRLQQWQATGNDFIGVGGATARSSGDTQVDGLLNGMLKGDKDARLTPAQVRDHAVMSTPGVGSPEVRELITALTSGDATAIDTARDKVRQKFGSIV